MGAWRGKFSVIEGKNRKRFHMNYAINILHHSLNR